MFGLVQGACVDELAGDVVDFLSQWNSPEMRLTEPAIMTTPNT